VPAVPPAEELRGRRGGRPVPGLTAASGSPKIDRGDHGTRRERPICSPGGVSFWRVVSLRSRSALLRAEMWVVLRVISPVEEREESAPVFPFPPSD
jgi:hypothetical protein